MTDLHVPDPPDQLSYADAEDFLNRQILERNGVAMTASALIAALSSGVSVIEAAAAHTLGCLAPEGAIEALRRRLPGAGDLVRVEVAHALARLGAPEGRPALHECLGVPVDAFLCPSIAAGYLARLGDPAGYPVVVRCFDVEITAVRMIACKQIYFFIPFQDQSVGSDKVDALALFDRALRDNDAGVQWQALVQLRELRSPRTRHLLEGFVRRTASEANREAAAEILAALAGSGAADDKASRIKGGRR